VGFDEVIVRGPPGHDDVRGDAGLVFAHTFEDAFALLGGWSAVEAGGSAKHHDCVEVICRRVVSGKGKVVAVDDEAKGKGEQKESEEEPSQESHAVRVAEPRAEPDAIRCGPRREGGEGRRAWAGT